MEPIILASILAADVTALSDEVGRIPSADRIHVDVMDDHFVGNLAFNLETVQHLARRTVIPIDAHLLIAHPERWVSKFVHAGAKSVVFHLEATDSPEDLVREIKDAGGEAGIAINPSTAIDRAVRLLPLLDVITVITVEPGFGGQPFLEHTLNKLEDLRADAGKHGVRLVVDGGISRTTIRSAALAGATGFVAGSAVFGQEEPDQAIHELRMLATL